MIQTVTLRPSRIGCPSIPGTMKGVVHSIPGVENVVVRYEERSLDISYDDAKASPEEIIKKIGAEMGISMQIAEYGIAKNKDISETCPM